jgi:hypothetical protein
MMSSRCISPVLSAIRSASASLFRSVSPTASRVSGDPALLFAHLPSVLQAKQETVAHAPDEYYVIKSTNPNVQGLDGAVMSFVEYLWELGR